MKKYALFTIILTTLNAYAGEVLTGGWQNQNTSDFNEVALEALNEKYKSNPKLVSIKEVRTQIVAGVNYNLIIKYKNKTKTSCANIKFYKNLSGTVLINNWDVIECSF